jgi:ABC-2 type transport system ATP-binding protein
VLLTTQYLDEADQLADRIAVIDHGKVIAEGTSTELKSSVGSGSLHVRVADASRREEARIVLERELGQSVQTEGDPTRLTARSDDVSRSGAALTALAQAGIEVSDFALGQPSLDEVFLALTGRPAESEVDGDREEVLQ